ncbi:MAG: GNAT family N-acetyltransferase [Kofleriaceae bacterium]
MAELVEPSARYELSFLESEEEPDARRELGDAGSFSALLAKLADRRAGIGLQSYQVPETTLWLVDGEHFIGRISIRHRLNDALRVIGGHIGYGIRPSRRAQGFGTKILRLALPHAAALGIDPALITCDATNDASRRVIERCGGVLDRGCDPTTNATLRYWVRTSS